MRALLGPPQGWVCAPGWGFAAPTPSVQWHSLRLSEEGMVPAVTPGESEPMVREGGEGPTEKFRPQRSQADQAGGEGPGHQTSKDSQQAPPPDLRHPPRVSCP